MFYLILFVFVLVGGILTIITLGNLFTMVHLVLFTWQAPALPLGLLLLLFTWWRFSRHGAISAR